MICILDVNLLPHERTVLDHGIGADNVKRVRKEFQEAIGATFKATVEHMTGRRVVGFLSDTHVDPPFTIEFFRLSPQGVEAEPAPDRDLA